MTDETPSVPQGLLARDMIADTAIALGWITERHELGDLKWDDAMDAADRTIDTLRAPIASIPEPVGKSCRLPSPGPDLIAKIESILRADPYGSRITSGSVEQIAALVARPYLAS